MILSGYTTTPEGCWYLLAAMAPSQLPAASLQAFSQLWKFKKTPTVLTSQERRCALQLKQRGAAEDSKIIKCERNDRRCRDRTTR